MASLLLRNVRELFSKELKERAARNGRTAEEEHRRLLEEALTEPTPPERQRYAVAKRLTRLLQMLNDGVRFRPEMTIPHMAELLGLNTATGLESYCFGEDEAPFDLLDRIAETFGLGAEWLKFGRYAPFNVRTYSVRELHLSNSSHPGHPRVNLAHVIQAEKPERIFFVRCLDRVRYATIFMQTSQWRYVGFYDGWHVSDHVGATGEAQLFDLWKLLKMIEDGHSVRHKVSGRDLPEDVFRALYGGEIFPGSVLWNERYYSNWADDFTDVNYEYPIGRDRYSRYGEEFQHAQARVRYFVNHEKEDKEKQQRHDFAP